MRRMITTLDQNFVKNLKQGIYAGNDNTFILKAKQITCERIDRMGLDAKDLDIHGRNYVSIFGADDEVAGEPKYYFDINKEDGVAISYYDSENDEVIKVMQFTPETGIVFNGLPTSDPHVAGALWNDNGTLKISAGGN